MPFADIAYLPQQQSASLPSSFSLAFLIFLSLAPLNAHSFAFPVLFASKSSCLLASSISSSRAKVILTSLSGLFASVLHVRFFVKGAGHAIRPRAFDLKKTVTFVCVSYMFVNGSHLITATHICMDVILFHMVNVRELGQDCSCLFLGCLFLVAFARPPVCMTSFHAGKANC